ncbi:glycosyltransferase family 4 protein [Actinomadura miaoliensis]|uniref:Glycosyltransferase family 4 protein n=1 Tax=Actinomadura miaoliensis TaxID=430685 RepID=A0ABP7WPH4_9ACTN
MRVLRLCSVFEAPVTALSGRGVRFDPAGGMQNHTAQLSRVLDELGVRQTVVTSRPPTAPATAPFGRHGTVVRFGVPVPRCRQFFWLPAWWQAATLTRGVDLVHAHLGEDLAIVPLAMHAAALADAPLVLTIHCSLRRTLRVGGPRSLVLKTAGGLLERYGSARADAVIVLTHRLRRDMPSAHVHVIPSGIGREFTTGPRRPVLPAHIPRPRVAYVGRLHPQKDVETLLRAFASLGTAHPAHLVIVGDGPERARLRRSAQRLGIAGRTHFTGFVPHEDVPSVLDDVDLLAYPSRYEELGTVLLEAMHCRVPVVASHVGGVPELVRHRRTGLLVPPHAPAALAAALRELLDDPVLSRELAGAAHELVRGYTWEHLGARVLDVYRSVLLPAPAGHVLA